MWLKAVWLERKKEVEGVLPSNWLKGNHVYWPPVVNANILFKQRAEPDVHKWLKFQLIKIKHSSDLLEDCEEYSDTSAAEITDAENLKKRSKPKNRDDCFQYDSLLSEDSGNENDLAQSNEIHNVIYDVQPVMPLPPMKISSMSNNYSSKPREELRLSRPRSPVYSPYTQQSQAKGGYRERSPSWQHLSHEQSPYTHSQSNYRSPRSQSCNRLPYLPRQSSLSSHRESNGRSPNNQERLPYSHDYSRSEWSRDRKSCSCSRSNSGERYSTPMTSYCKSSSSSESIEQFALHGDGQSKKNRPKDSFPMSEEKFQKRVLMYLLDIKDMLTLKSSSQEYDPSVGAFSFTPLSTLDELDQFNITILDQDMHRNLVYKFTRLGGVSLKDMVNNIMNRLMTNALMSQLNMKGSRGQKKGFAEMPACSFITECVLQEQPKATVSEALEAIKKHLKYAPKRK